MSARSFYTSTQAELASGAQNLIAIVTPNPATFGVPVAQLTNFTTLSTNYSTLLNQATQPTTNARSVIASKDAARNALRQAARLLAQVIAGTPSVTDAQLVSLRLPPRVKAPTPPMTDVAPVVSLVNCANRQARIRISDPSDPARRGKARGSVGANIFTFVGEQPPEDPSQFYYQGMATRTLANIQFPATVPSGATIWVSACWVGRRGEFSQCSAAVNFTLQGGTTSARAGEETVQTRLAA